MGLQKSIIFTKISTVTSFHLYNENHNKTYYLDFTLSVHENMPKI